MLPDIYRISIGNVNEDKQGKRLKDKGKRIKDKGKRFEVGGNHKVMSIKF